MYEKIQHEWLKIPPIGVSMNEPNSKHLRRVNILMNHISKRDGKSNFISSPVKSTSKNYQIGPYIGNTDQFLKKIFKK